MNKSGKLHIYLTFLLMSSCGDFFATFSYVSFKNQYKILGCDIPIKICWKKFLNMENYFYNGICTVQHFYSIILQPYCQVIKITASYCTLSADRLNPVVGLYSLC
jgi:hypothetical protein